MSNICYPLLRNRVKVIAMSWFNASGFSTFAKSAISQAQKSIDKVLDIKEGDGNGGTTGRLANTSKSKSSAEGYSSSQKHANFVDSKNDDDFDDGMHNFGKYGKKGPEEDSFFSSYLGSDRHSTPKVNPETNRKSISPSTSVLENSSEDARRSNRKKNENSGSLSISTVEAKCKTEQSQDKSKLQSSSKKSAKLKKDSIIDEKGNDGNDLVKEFLADRVSTTCEVTAAEAEALSSKSVLNFAKSANNDADLAGTADGSEAVEVQSDVDRSDIVDDTDSCENEHSDYLAESNNICSDQSKSSEESYKKQNSVESEETLSKSTEESKEEKEIDNFGNDSSSMQNNFEAEVENCHNKDIIDSIDVPESFRDRNMTHTEKTVTDVNIPNGNNSSEFANDIEDATYLNEDKREVVEDEKDDKSLHDNSDASVLLHEDSYELMAASDFVGDDISEKSHPISVGDKEDYPTEIKGDDKDGEISHVNGKSIFRNETLKCSDQVDDSENDGPTTQCMELEENDCRASFNRVSNDGGAHNTINEDSAPNQLTKNNLCAVQKGGRLVEDVAAEPDHKKLADDQSVTSSDNIELQKVTTAIFLLCGII